MTTALLSSCGLGMDYRSADQVVSAVRALDLELEAGEFVVIMGASGSGKSTLLYLLAGLERPSRGAIHAGALQLQRLDDTALARWRRRSVGFVFQAINLVPDLTLLENILVPGGLVPDHGTPLETRARQLLEAVGLSALADRLPAQVSGGEQQRAAIARALINRPALLFADEPTGALNSAASAQVLDLLQQLHVGGQTVVLVTHDVQVGCRGQRVVYLRDGAIVDSLRFAAELPRVQRERQLRDWLARQGW